ncbi:outer membrane beta-barrel protein [Polaribacter sp. L3A8]|uniref:outer membrane beta-barrel protein n=1 Tax=Polaribacter sp. L3A8 TaxID=2686361 RepID=UPI00131CFE7D|nr:outer membrane beta-barrel protein [Polaribacter sp. L3A8]
MNQNNLDKLFQEQLNNLEATPNKRVWNNIESKLKKKKRRVVPFWWFGSGVAAMLLLGLFLFPFSDDKTDAIKTDSKIIITESSKKELEIIDNAKVDAVIKNEIKEEMLFVDKKLNANSIKSKRNTIKNTENKNKLVSTKNAMKKIFLADKFTKPTEDSVNNNHISIDEKEIVVAENKNISIQKQITKTDKESPKNKVDLNKFIEKKDSVFYTKSLKKKWSIAPVFAVLKSNSFSNGSPINEHLSNSTKGKNSFSYGFNIGYQINEKWSIQSGVHLQEMGFKNNQVTAVPSISKSSLPVVFNNGDSFSFNEEEVAQSSDFISNSALNKTSLNGDLSQNYGYIEIPLEVKYNFLNTKKFNTQVVVGFSSLFLNKNAVNFSTSIISTSGKSKNLNNINFSGNLGFDFNYSLNKKWSLNLNPMFKAQVHTFSEDANGFSPFNLGVYSGIKYKF